MGWGVQVACFRSVSGLWGRVSGWAVLSMLGSENEDWGQKVGVSELEFQGQVQGLGGEVYRVRMGILVLGEGWGLGVQVWGQVQDLGAGVLDVGSLRPNLGDSWVRAGLSERGVGI